MSKKSQRSSGRRRTRQISLPVPDSVTQRPEPSVESGRASIRSEWVAAATAAALISGLCAVLYAWTVDFPMVFDDYVYLETNPLVRDSQSFGYLSHLREFAAQPARLGLPADLATNFILRPVAYLTFHFNYLLDGYRPHWYRVFNIGVHAVNGMLIYALLRILLAKAASLPRGSSKFMAGTAALLFVAHPLATESVTYIVQRFTSLETTFYLSCLCLHFAAPGARSKAMRRLARGAAVVALVLGMLTKESAVTAPVVAVMLDWLVVRNTFINAIKAARPLLACLPIVPAMVIMAAWAQNGDGVTLGDAVNITNLNENPWNHWHYAVTQITVVVSYLRRLVWPSGLNLDPQWPVYKSLFAWPVVLSEALVVTLILAALRVHRSFKRDIRAACILAFVLWYFATIIVSSGLVPLPDLIAEHRSYLPSVGIFIALASVLDLLRNWNGVRRCGRWLAPLLALAAVTGLGRLTVERNKVWSSAVSLWEDTVAKSPGNARVWGNLGAAYTTANRYVEAVPCYQKAIELEPKYQTAYLNLASVLNALHQSKTALDVIGKLFEIDKRTQTSPDVQCNRGIALIEMGRVDEGVRLLNAIIDQKPEHTRSHIVLALLYSQIHDPRKALLHCRQALQQQPGDTKLVALMHAAEQAAGNVGAE